MEKSYFKYFYFLRVVIPLCGGNIDTTVLGRVLERGLVADKRLLKLWLVVR
jgi:threonine dehydratase